MDISLKGKHALVCGASQGIGAATATALADLGAEITLVSRSLERLQLVAEELSTEQRQNHRVLVADFSDPEALKDKASALVARHPVHILINNTGGPPGGPAHSANLDEYHRAFSQHVICNQILAQTVLAGMRQADYGRIINIISTSVKQPIPGLGVSNTIRGAVANWAKTLATELGPEGITVNNVLPGFTDTGRLAALIQAKAVSTGITEQEMADKMRSTVPMKRFAQAAEVANAVAFLASPAAAYINGINLPVDGGRTSSL